MPRGECHFFNNDERFSMGLTQYAKLLPLPNSESRLVGDDTPTYSYLPKVPERIFSMLPQVKILWILRDPLERAISNYWHDARAGVEDRSIEKAFVTELSGKEDNIWRRYLKRSFYKEQIGRYLEVFPRENIHFIKFQDFVNDCSEEKKEITKFLRINPIHAEVPHVNQTNWWPRPFVTRLIAPRAYEPVRKKNIRRKFGYELGKEPALSVWTRAKAENLLAEKNAGLEDLIGVKLFKADVL